jgi:hypothetical protein
LIHISLLKRLRLLDVVDIEVFLIDNL